MTGDDFIKSALRQLRLYRSLGEKSIGRLDTAQLNTIPQGESNSIAVIVRHMAGNMKSRWTDFLTSDGEKTWRNRDSEFEEPNESKESILHRWNEGWELTLSVIGALRGEDIDREVRIRNESMSAAEAIHRQIAHYAYHVGQIVYVAKMQLGANWESLSIPRKRKPR
jgi:hypothetical protein